MHTRIVALTLRMSLNVERGKTQAPVAMTTRSNYFDCGVTRTSLSDTARSINVVRVGIEMLRLMYYLSTDWRTDYRTEVITSYLLIVHELYDVFIAVQYGFGCLWMAHSKFSSD